MDCEIFIQVVHQGHAGGDIHAGDFISGNAFQMLSESADGIAMSGDEDLFTLFDFRADHFIKVWCHTRHGIFQTFCQRQLHLVLKFLVWRLVFRASGVGGIQRGRRHVVGTAPQVHLRFAVFIGGFRLVQALECAVVAFIQVVILFHRNPGEIHGIEHRVSGVNGSFQHRRVAFIEGKSFFFQKLAGFSRFPIALFGDFYVSPAAKQVFLIPFTFAMTDNN